MTYTRIKLVPKNGLVPTIERDIICPSYDLPDLISYQGSLYILRPDTNPWYSEADRILDMDKAYP